MSQRLAPRDVLGRTLTDLAQKDPDVVVLDADFWPASKIAQFKDRFSDRFIEVGIAEQNMMGIAAGLSTVGFTCFASTLCVFCSRRACDQVTTSIALPRLNVKILGLYAGLFVGKNGASHQALEDIAIMRSIANMAVVQPADALETEQVVRFGAEYDGPMYVRVGRDPRPQFVPDNYKFRLGKACTLREGKDVTLITCGDTVENTLAAAESLARNKIEARVINMRSIKPIDEEALVKAAQETGKIVTIDNHNILGGLGSAVCEVVTEKTPVKVKRIGVTDIFGKSGTNQQMEAHFGLQAEDVEKQVLSFLQN
jgi:transketolase